MIEKKVVIVTGTSSGFGEAIVRRLVSKRANVVGVARREDRLQLIENELENAPGKFIPIVTDVTSPNAAEMIVNTTIERFGQLDVLVNNAGIMLHGPVLNGDYEDFSRMIDVNLKAPIAMCIAALPHLIKTSESSPDGADIVMMSSLMGRVCKPHKGGYNATKFGLNAFSESLRQELIGKFVRVSMIEPGMAETEIAYKVKNKDEREAGFSYRNTIELLSAEDIANCVEFIIDNPRNVNITELLIRPTQQL